MYKAKTGQSPRKEKSLTPDNPLFMRRFVPALNVRLKKQMPGEVDYTHQEIKLKVLSIAHTVLADMGLKDWKVLMSVHTRKDGKANLGIAFKKVQTSKIWTPPGMKR